jgi:hypothetical protein
MNFGNEIGISFKGRADFSQARTEVTNFRGLLKKEFDSIGRDIAGGAGGMGRFVASLGPVGLALGITAGAATIATGAFAAMISRGVELGSRLHDLSLETGLTVETLSGLESQLKESGTSTEALGNAVLFMHKNLGQAAEGNKQLKATFAELGIKDVDAALRDTDGSLRTIIKSLGQLTDEGERDRLGSEALGRAYKELRVFIADTGGDIDEVMRKAREAGLVMGDEVAGNLDDLGDAWDRLDHKTQVMGANFAGTVAPELTKALDDISAALSGNTGEWGTWAQGAAVAIARVRGGMEGAAKWWHGDTWSPWDLGKQIEQGRDAAEIGMMTDLLYNLNKPKDKPKASGGGSSVARRGGGGKGKKSDDSRLDALNADDKELEVDFKRESDALARDYKNRLDTLEEFTSSEIALLDVWIKEKRAVFDQEEAEVNRSVKNADDREKKLREIQEKRVAASDVYDREKNAAEDRLADERKRAAEARADALLNVDQAVGRKRIAAIEAVADLGIKRESQAAKEIGDIQIEMHDRAVRRLKERLEQEQFGSAEYRRIQGEIAVAEVERAELAEAVAHRVEMAKRREIEAARQLLDELRDVELQIRDMEIDAWERENRFQTRGERRGVINSRADAAIDAENERHRRVVARLEQMRKEGRDEQAIHKLEEAEARRHNIEMGRIEAERKKAEDGLDPFGPLKDLWKEWKRDAKDASGSISRDILVMSEVGVGAIGAMTDALKQGIAANILYGASIGAALKKALAEQLASFAAEADIRALREFALSLTSLAMLDFRGAAAHAAAGAAWLAVGLAVGKGASALAKSAGLRGAGTGASGGAAIAESAEPKNQKYNYGSSQESASEAGRDGTRGGVGNMVMRLVDRVEAAHKQNAAMNARLDATLSRINGIPADHVVTMGAPGAHEAIGVAVLRQSSSNDDFNDEMARNMRVA